MKKFMNYKTLFLLNTVFLVAMMMYASQKPAKYYVFNRNNGKIYRYQLIKPNEQINWQPAAADSFSIVTRLIMPEQPDSQYVYQVKYDGLDITVTRDLNHSKVSRGLNGDDVSSWNRYRSYLMNPQTGLTLINTSGSELLVKIRSDNYKVTRRYKTESDYFAYPPDAYDNSLDILVNDKEYTYYQGTTNGIALELEGPLNLKIINRLIIDQVDMLSFSWKALIDNDEVLYVEDSVPYSTSCLADSSSSVTQGLTNILEVPAGKHQIRILDEEPPGIIYRLYISKSSIGK